MARSTKLNLGSFDLDKSLDIPDFDFDIGVPKDDGKPVRHLVKGFSSGFFSTVRSASFLKNTLKLALPQGYGSAIDFADTSARSFKELYDSSIKDIKPQLNEVARLTGRILPKDATSDGDLMKKLRKFAGSYEAPEGQQAQVDPREAGLAAALGSVFDAQQQMEDRRGKVQDIKDRLSEGLTHARHKDVIQQLDAIRRASAQQAAYTTNITANYHRRSLELQYRHYFLAMDQLQEQKRFGALAGAALEGILRNTALSDHEKLSAVAKSKNRPGFIRNNFVNPLVGGIFGAQRDFAKNLVQSLVKQAQGGVKRFAGGVGAGIQGADLLLDNADLASSFGESINPYEIGGEFAGSGLAEILGNRVGNWARPKLRNFTGVRKGGNKLQYGIENAQPLLSEWANSGRNENGLLGYFTRFLKSGIKNTPGVDRSLQRENITALQEPAVFDRGVSRSITEIIPGYLARIFRELQVMRTGDNKTELTEFDHAAGKFNSRSQVRQGLFNSLVDSRAKETTTKDVDRLVDQVGGQSLTPEQRTALGHQLLRDNVMNRGGSFSRLTNSSSYTGTAAPHAETFSKLFSAHQKSDTDAEKQYDFSSKFNALGRYAKDPRALIQTLANNGQLEFLQEAGIVDAAGTKIDLEKYYAYLYQQGGYQPGSEGVGGESRPFHPASPSVSPGGGSPSFVKHTTINKAQENGPLMAAIKDASSKQEAGEIRDLLDEIADILDAGIPTYSAGPGPGGEGEPPDNGRRTIGGHVRHFGKRLRKGAGGLMRRVAGTVQGIQNRASGLFSGAARLATGGLSDVLDRVRGFRDVYIKGRAIPALTAARLKAGEYIDQKSGKVIATWKDIQGTIVDKDGNIIITAEEVKNAFIKSTLGEKLITTLGAAGKWSFGKLIQTGAQFSSGLGAALTIGRGVASMGLDIGKRLLGVSDDPTDVYVKGEKEPALLKRLMLAGAYRDQKTGKTINKPSDISGPVIDDDGNVVLSLANLKAGLVDHLGKPFQSLREKVTQLLGGGLKRAFGVLGSIRTGLGNVLGGVKDFLTGGLGAFIGRDGIIFSGSKKIVSELQEIYDLLYARLPENPHFRKGSIDDLRSARAKKDADAARNTKPGKEDGAPTKGLLTRLAGLFGRKKKDSDESDSKGGGVDINLGGGAAKTVEKDAAKAAETLAKRGRLGRLGAGLGKAAVGVGKAGLGLLGVGGGVLGGLGSAASGVAGAAGAVGGGLLTAAGALGSGLATAAGVVGGGLLSAIGAIAASPVLLGGLAAAGVGYGAYKVYQHFTQNNLSELNKARFVQYGFLKEQTDYVHLCFTLEDICDKGTVFADGIAKFDDKKIDFKKGVELFGVDLNDRKAVANWVRWFATRFKPIYLTARSALNKVNPKVAFGDIDSKLTNGEKKRYFAIARWDNGPYSELSSPVPALQGLQAGPAQVKEVLDATQADLDKLPVDKNEKSSSTPTAMDLRLAKTATIAGAITGAITSPLKALGVGGKTVDVKAIQNLAGGAAAGLQATRGLLFVAGDASAINQGWNGRVDAVTAVRFKTYGLAQMDQDKVSMLSNLEQAIDDQVVFGPDKIAKWNGDANQILAKQGAAFGVAGPASREAYDWLSWYRLRFLPTYLNYRTALRQATQKDTAAEGFVALKAADKVTVATATLTTSVPVSGRTVPVWSVPYTPWKDYVLNAEVSTTDGNIKGLKEEAKTDKLAEETAFSQKPSATNGKGSAATPPPPTTLVGKVEQAVGNAFTATKTFFKQASTAAGLAAAGQSVTGATLNTAASGSLTGGQAVSGTDKGTGGLYQSLPTPTGKGWAACKPLVLAAAKMVGIDPHLLAVMMAIESGFDPSAKAGTSSAAGLMQFISATWQTMLKKYGSKYGIPPGTAATDARASALMGAEFIKENAQALSGVKAQLTDTDLYLAHFLGPAGAKKLLSASPQANAVQLMPDAARANTPIFYQNGTPRTVAEVYAEINRRVRAASARVGLGTDDGSEAVSSSPSAPKGAAGGATSGAPGVTAAPGTDSVKGVPGGGSGAPAGPGGPSLKGPATIPTNPGGGDPSTSGAAPQRLTTGKGGGGTGPSRAAAAAGAPSLAPPGQSAAAAAGGGFDSDLMTNMPAQQKSQDQARAASMGPLPDILGKQLDIQTQMRDLLKQIADNGGNIAANAQPSNSQGAAPGQNKTAGAATKAPVSMRRQTSF